MFHRYHLSLRELRYVHYKILLYSSLDTVTLAFAETTGTDSHGNRCHSHFHEGWFPFPPIPSPIFASDSHFTYGIGIPIRNGNGIPMNISTSFRDGDITNVRYLHSVSKKLCQLIFCSFSVKYEPISITIGRIVPEETLHKTVPRMPTSPKVCACTTLGNLKCQIEPSTQ